MTSLFVGVYIILLFLIVVGIVESNDVDTLAAVEQAFGQLNAGKNNNSQKDESAMMEENKLKH